MEDNAQQNSNSQIAEAVKQGVLSAWKESSNVVGQSESTSDHFGFNIRKIQNGFLLDRHTRDGVETIFYNSRDLAVAAAKELIA